MKTSKLIFIGFVSCLLLSSSMASAAEHKAGKKKSAKHAQSYMIKEERIVIDRSERTNPYGNTPSYAQGGDTSRYSTSQGWSRGRNSYWWGGRSSDMASTGYNTPGY